MVGDSLIKVEAAWVFTVHFSARVHHDAREWYEADLDQRAQNRCTRTDTEQGTEGLVVDRSTLPSASLEGTVWSVIATSQDGQR